MDFSFALACIVAFVVSIEANGNTGLSYTDSLLGSYRTGLRRNDRLGPGINNTGPVLVRECRDNFDCRAEEYCELGRLAVGRCVGDLQNLGGTVGGDYVQTGVLRNVGGVRRDQNYDSGLPGVGVGLPGQRCQIFDSQTCLATPGDLSPTLKYTYDYTRGNCVRVQVCDTCAAYEGPRYNLFHDERVCNRLCSNTVRPTY